MLVALWLLASGGCGLQGSSKVANVSQSGFDATVSGTDLVLVKFGASWCGPCVRVDQELVKVAGTFAGRAEFVKVDIDSNRELATRYKVRGIPHMVLFQNGRPVDQRVGFQSAAQIESWLRQSGAATPTAESIQQNPFVSGV